MRIVTFVNIMEVEYSVLRPHRNGTWDDHLIYLQAFYLSIKKIVIIEFINLINLLFININKNIHIT